jgi:hypothetical protein
VAFKNENMANSDNQNFIARFTRKKVFGLIPLVHFAGLLIGAAGGYLYYHFIGCQSGTCSITSNPWLTVLWGVAIGYLISDLFYKKEDTTPS